MPVVDKFGLPGQSPTTEKVVGQNRKIIGFCYFLYVNMHMTWLFVHNSIYKNILMLMMMIRVVSKQITEQVTPVTPLTVSLKFSFYANILVLKLCLSAPPKSLNRTMVVFNFKKVYFIQISN